MAMWTPARKVVSGLIIVSVKDSVLPRLIVHQCSKLSQFVIVS